MKELYEEIREEETTGPTATVASYKILGWEPLTQPCLPGLEGWAHQEGTTKQVGGSSVADTLAQRGGVYGKFSAQLECVSYIVQAMEKCAINNGVTVDFTHLRTEWHYLAIKLARIASNPEHTDSYHDLAGYAMLLEGEYGATN